MSDRFNQAINLSTEIKFACLTFLSTLISGNFLMDLLTATVTYAIARLFYFYFGDWIKVSITKIKDFFNKFNK